MAREAREQWAKRVERWKDSGLSAKEFAAETGVKASTLSYWKWRLGSEKPRKQPREVPAARKPQRSSTATTPARATFVEIGALTAAASEPFELVFESGLRVRVPMSFDPSDLGRLLDVVASR